ncbi:MAG: MFS transporter [Planctomycetes bacterium]|nr:MFS transporter [Planctomycetota bacterium]
MLFFVLYLMEGMPIGFVWWTLPTLLSSAGVDTARIGDLTSVVVLPWAFKAFVGPIVDLGRNARWSHRAWIVVAQGGMALSLVPLLTIDFTADFDTLRLCLIAHACAAAFQDVAIDALAVEVTPLGERGGINGWAQAGMLLGRGVVAAFAIRIGAGSTSTIVTLLIGFLVVGQLVHWTYRGPAPRVRDTGADGKTGNAYRRALRQVLRSPMTWLLVVFAATSGAAFEMLGAMLGPFLHSRGATDDGIAWFYALPALVGLGGGALLGGMLSDRFGSRRIAIWAACAVAGTTAGAATVSGAEWTWIFVAAAYLATGVFTAASYALYMNATHPRLAATQFSAMMGLTNLCESWSARVAGRISKSSGFKDTFLLGAGVTLLSLTLLIGVRGKRLQQRNHD